MGTVARLHKSAVHGCMHAACWYIYMYMGTCSWNGHMQAMGVSPVATVVIAHSHVQLYYNTQAEKQGMVARLQAWQMLADVGMVKTYS